VAVAEDVGRAPVPTVKGASNAGRGGTPVGVAGPAGRGGVAGRGGGTASAGAPVRPGALGRGAVPAGPVGAAGLGSGPEGEGCGRRGVPFCGGGRWAAKGRRSALVSDGFSAGMPVRRAVGDGRSPGRGGTTLDAIRSPLRSCDPPPGAAGLSGKRAEGRRSPVPDADRPVPGSCIPDPGTPGALGKPAEGRPPPEPDAPGPAVDGTSAPGADRSALQSYFSRPDAAALSGKRAEGRRSPVPDAIRPPPRSCAPLPGAPGVPGKRADGRPPPVADAVRSPLRSCVQRSGAPGAPGKRAGGRPSPVPGVPGPVVGVPRPVVGGASADPAGVRPGRLPDVVSRPAVGGASGKRAEAGGGGGVVGSVPRWAGGREFGKRGRWPKAEGAAVGRASPVPRPPRGGVGPEPPAADDAPVPSGTFRSLSRARVPSVTADSPRAEGPDAAASPRLKSLRLKSRRRESSRTVSPRTDPRGPPSAPRGPVPRAAFAPRAVPNAASGTASGTASGAPPSVSCLVPAGSLPPSVSPTGAAGTASPGCVTGFGGCGGLGGRGGTGAWRASVLMRPPFPRARAVARARPSSLPRPARTRCHRARIPVRANRHPGSMPGPGSSAPFRRTCASLYGLPARAREPVRRARGICPERPPTLR
jgi:hypothetical protein